MGTVGIGLALAGVGAGRLVEEHAPRAALLVGTCGAYAERGIRIGEVVVARSVRLVCPSAVEGRAAFPEPMPLALDADAALGAALAEGARLADVATTLAVTTEDALARRIADGTGADVEHLEAFAVATACAAASVAFAAVFGIANVVGSSARAEWRANHHAASEAAAAHVARWIERGAPGIP
jgi:futalosine hydrolase